MDYQYKEKTYIYLKIVQLISNFKNDMLDVHLFEDISQVRILTEEWIKDYNMKRPHEALGGITPERYEKEFSSKQACLEEQKKSSNQWSEKREGYRVKKVNHLSVRKK